jgi:hypothetical protein
MWPHGHLGEVLGVLVCGAYAVHAMLVSNHCLCGRWLYSPLLIVVQLPA